MLERLKNYWATRTNGQKTRIVGAGLAVAYSGLVKVGWAPASESWTFVKELVFALLNLS